MARAARFGDACDHGGTVISGSPSLSAEGMPVARVGDFVDCAVHGQVSIVTGSPVVWAEGEAVAHVGSQLSCGGVIIEGSPSFEVPT